MNPPAAIHSAMSRERKPFTYTPGGLDLSQIKSERMAQRLIRNALDQGVPETQIQPVSSPPTPSTPIAVPNYNCLPVQVFPTFPLPPNPKSLLRARSIPNQPKESQRSDPENIRDVNIKSHGINHIRDALNQNTPAFSQIRNSNSTTNRPVSMYEFSSVPVSGRTDYGSNGCTSLLPEITYDAEYFQVVPKKSGGNELFKLPISNQNEKRPSVNQDLGLQSDITHNLVTIDVPSDSNNVLTTTFSTPDSEDQRGVRLVKKHVKKDKKVEKIEKRIENQNGDVAHEAEITVKLPSKKPETKLNTNIEPGAKTETEVDVLKKILPDGSVEEVKTTTIKTTKDGKTETETKTETRKLPKEEADGAKQQARRSQLENKEKKDENGDIDEDGGINEDIELVVKLPTKKTGATTETKVEIENKILSDGTVEETKTTTTKTTVDGKIEVTTKVDKRILSKEEADAAIEVTEEEEEEVEEEEETNAQNEVSDDKEEKDIENNLIKNTERTEITTTKNVVVTQSSIEKYESEEEIEDEGQTEADIEKKDRLAEQQESVEMDEEEIEEDKEIEEEDTKSNSKEIKEESTVEELIEDAKTEKPVKETRQKEDEEEVHIEEEEEEVEEEEEELEKVIEPEIKEEIQTKSDDEEKEEIDEEENEEEITEEVEVKEEKKQSLSVKQEPEGSDEDQQPEKDETSRTITIEPPSKMEQNDLKEQKISYQEPTVPLEKVEEIEIKPIGLSNETISKSQTEKTEITVSTEKPSGPLSTQTEFNRYENIVKVNRTTKTLDHAYEQITQQSTPTMKTYFAPNREKVSPSHPAQRGGTYDTTYVPDSTTERRHSLLLERLSVERQIPPMNSYQNNYQQYTNQTHEQQQSWSQEPQSEVVTVSNVKPSKITNQHWYQQSTKDSVIYNNVSSTVPSTPNQQWNQPQPQYQSQPQYHPHSQYQTQPQYQSQPQYQPQSQYQPQPQYQSQPEPPFQNQPQFQAQPQFQPQTQPQYQQPYTDYKQPDYSRTNSNSYQNNSYVPKISNWGTSTTEKAENVSNQCSFLSKEMAKPYQNTPQFSADYVPPPWEQESSSIVDSSNQNFYQTQPPPKSTFTPSPSAWKPPPTPSSKFSKPTPTAYIPPAPNQSFVKSGSVAESPKTPGRKTYYSEYERRYISVPESNYIPGETKLQPQPDPSPKYYYDNNEPNETVEHQWRKELREFSEKTSQTLDRISVKPPWEEDPKYTKTPSTTPYTPTPSWSQTLRPRSWRERSFESEYVGSQEWPKTNTLGRGRPVSSYIQSKTDVNVPEKPRGVSVDRYNPNSYQSPIAEHPPVQSHTLTPTTAPHAKSYHNPNIPAYHARASAEPREQPASYQQPRLWGDSRDTPIQSRSFKYLQWITGTEN